MSTGFRCAAARARARLADGRQGTPVCRRDLSPRERARIQRQTAVVHDCQMPVWARQLMAEEVEELERQEIRGALLEAGIL